MFVYRASTTPISHFAVYAYLAYLFGPSNGFRIRSQYNIPNWSDSDVRPGMSGLVTDYMFECPLRYALRGLKAEKSNLWSYRFDHILSFPTEAWGQNFSFCYDEVCHGAELALLFSPSQIYRLNFSETRPEMILAVQMMTDWGQFATTGRVDHNPYFSSPSGAKWRYTTSDDPEGGPGPLPNTKDAICDMWDEIGYLHGYGSGGDTPPVAPGDEFARVPGFRRR